MDSWKKRGERKKLSEANLKNEKIKIGLNTAILAIFFPFNRRYSVLFIFLPTLQTSFGSQVCFELLDCLHRFSAYPEDGSLLSALERILPGNICIAGRQKLVGKALAPVAVVVMLQVDMLKQHQNQAYFWYWSFMGIKKLEYWYMTEKLNKHFLRSVN